MSTENHAEPPGKQKPVSAQQGKLWTVEEVLGGHYLCYGGRRMLHTIHDNNLGQFQEIAYLANATLLEPKPEEKEQKCNCATSQFWVRCPIHDETPAAGEHSTLQGQAELRVRVAELRGWRDCHCTAGLPCGIPPWLKGRSDDNHQQLPNWPADLNACAELIDSLKAKGWWCETSNIEGKWRCCFRHMEGGRGSLIFRAINLSEAICCAFVALHEGKSVHEL